jgi:cytochrome P450
LREDGAVHLRSYDHVLQLLQDPNDQRFSQDVSWTRPNDAQLPLAWRFVWGAGARRADGTPGRNAILRKLGGPWFHARGVTALAGRIQAHADTLVRAIVQTPPAGRPAGECDLARELAYPLALRVSLTQLGLPADREDWLQRQIRRVELAPMRREPQAVRDWLRHVVADRRAQRRGAVLDLLDALILARRNETITEPELLGYVWGTLVASATTATHIANLVGLLGEFKLLDVARARRDDRHWLRRASEEAMRYTTPSPIAPLVAVQDLILDGVEIAAGTPLRGHLSAANRDRAVNGDNPRAASPDVFDPARQPNHHLAFGAGPHYCLGAPLARAETLAALRSVLQLPGLELDTSKRFGRYVGVNFGVDKAPVRFDQRGAERVFGAGRAGRATDDRAMPPTR